MAVNKRFFLAGLILLAVGGCGGSAKISPSKTPRVPVQVIRQSSEPLRLRYRWAKSSKLVYQFSNLVPSKSGGSGLEQDFEVGFQGDAKGEFAQVEGRLLKLKTILFDQPVGTTELEPMAFSAKVDSRGRLSNFRQTAGEDKLSFLELGDTLVDSHVFGFPEGGFRHRRV